LTIIADKTEEDE